MGKECGENPAGSEWRTPPCRARLSPRTHLNPPTESFTTDRSCNDTRVFSDCRPKSPYFANEAHDPPACHHLAIRGAGGHCRENSAHTKNSRPDSGRGFQVKVPIFFMVSPLCSQRGRIPVGRGPPSPFAPSPPGETHYPFLTKVLEGTRTWRIRSSFPV